MTIVFYLCKDCKKNFSLVEPDVLTCPFCSSKNLLVEREGIGHKRHGPGRQKQRFPE